MKNKLLKSILCAFVLVFSFVFIATAQQSQKALVIELNDDIINPVTSEYISHAIDKAEKQKAQCLIIKLDTPGGLLNSTRSIVKKILTANVPVVVYIAPNGARAGSAGVFITYASHIAAMAPSTNIGAAHPVEMGPGGNQPRPKDGDWDELKQLINELEKRKDKKEDASKTENDKEIKPDENPLETKILNDTVAFIRAIAKERHRNEDWAVESVAKSSSITSDEAIKKNVVEIIATDENDLLKQLNGRTVTIKGSPVTLNTAQVSLEYLQMDARQKFFNALANPNIAYFLLILGFYGLLFEITHPGASAPGVFGAIFLILALYSMQTLPTNYAGLALLTLGFVLLIAEILTPGFGVLFVGGIICMALGSMLLFESVDPLLRVSRSAIIGVIGSTSLLTIFLFQRVIKSRGAKIKSGEKGMIGEIGEAQSTIMPNVSGKVYVHGEIWSAESNEHIQKGDEIHVVKVEGLKLKVRKHKKE
jgi:membrane-bound serine protease (ClpP class)